MSKQVLLESIVSFQSIESFEQATSLDYSDLDDHDLMDALLQWHYPGEHDTDLYDANHVNSNFLGFEYEHDKNFLISRYENGLVIGLSHIIERK